MEKANKDMQRLAKLISKLLIKHSLSYISAYSFSTSANSTVGYQFEDAHNDKIYNETYVREVKP